MALRWAGAVRAQQPGVRVDTYTEGGQVLFQAAIEQFNIPAERQSVPTLIIDDIVLVGSLEIPQQFPGLVETYLAQGGVDWPRSPWAG